MHKIKNKYNTKENDVNKILLFGMLIFTLGTFTIKSFLGSLTLEATFLILMNISFIVYYLKENKKIIVNKLEIMWSIFIIYFLFNIIYQNIFYETYLIDILLFLSIFLYLTMIKLELVYFKKTIKVMMLITILYALGSWLQFINIDLYVKVILPLFDNASQTAIMRLYNYSSAYSGLTTQIAHNAGYLAYGLGIFIFTLKNKDTKISKSLSFVGIIILIAALILTSKRAHFIFTIISLIMTLLLSTNIKRMLKQLLKLTSIITILFFIVRTSIKLFEPNRDTPIIGNLYYRMQSTVEGLSQGEDITSGRSILYDYSIKLFNENPIFGIGWKNFYTLSNTIFENSSGSHPHNIYVQLLTELGIIGFTLFLIPIIYSLIKTIKLLMISNTSENNWVEILQISLYGQLFFIFYGLTGNLLTDHFYILMWTFSASITLSANYYMKENIKYKDVYNG